MVHVIWPVIVPGQVPMAAAPFGPPEGVLPTAAEHLVTEALRRAEE
ncbi:hypothetical protein ABZT51_45570 [Streptomyces sp. NPDC005373]